MSVVWCLMVMSLTTMVIASTVNVGDAEYFEMPRLYHLDDWDECVAIEGTFCLGTFELLKLGNDKLYNKVENFSSCKYHFNHTLVHRGYCLQKSCSHIQGSSDDSRFIDCVSNLTSNQHGLATKHTTLKYCRTNEARTVDSWDWVVFGIIAAIILMNIWGTSYDMLKSSEAKRNKMLTCWSLRVNWRRLQATRDDDPRLSAMMPLNGLKAESEIKFWPYESVEESNFEELPQSVLRFLKNILLIPVIYVHACYLYHTTYITNPQFLEQNSYRFLAILIQNSTVIVEILFMISSFLFAYYFLIYNKDKGFRLLPRMIIHRIIRLTPMNLFIIGFATSWWAHIGDGPLWPMVGAEVAACRSKWWTHVFYVNNLFMADVNCLVHTWYIAVDFQLYIIYASLTLLLVQYPRATVKLLLLMIAGSIVVNFTVVYNWSYKPMVVLMFPEMLRAKLTQDPSFMWLYKSWWSSMPSALIGLLVAFIHHRNQVKDYKPAQSMVIRVMSHMSLPALVAWMMMGFWMRDVIDPVSLALYASLDRPVTVACAALCIYGLINHIDSVWRRFFCWRGWEVIGRMSLSIYLVHWFFSMSLLAVRTTASEASNWFIIEYWLLTTVLSLCAAVPLYLMIELPCAKSLQALFSV